MLYLRKESISKKLAAVILKIEIQMAIFMGMGHLQNARH